MPILVQFANPLAIRQSLAILPIHYKSWTNLPIYCQSTNFSPIHSKYQYSKRIHPQSANSNSITKSNDNPLILDQNANSIPILKQSANLCLISWQWAYVIPILDHSATPMHSPDQSTYLYPIHQSLPNPQIQCQTIWVLLTYLDHSTWLIIHYAITNPLLARRQHVIAFLTCLNSKYELSYRFLHWFWYSYMTFNTSVF